jgi:hypothetical protein
MFEPMRVASITGLEGLTRSDSITPLNKGARDAGSWGFLSGAGVIGPDLTQISYTATKSALVTARPVPSVANCVCATAATLPSGS